MPEDQQINRRLTRIEDQIDAILSQLPGEKKEKSSTTKQAQEIVTLIAAALAAVAGTAFIFYAFGYVIVNTYLASFGVRVSELTNPAYIPAGLLFVFIGLIIPTVVVVVFWEITNYTYRSTRVPVLLRSLFIALCIGVFIWIFTDTFLVIASGAESLFSAPSFTWVYALWVGLACAIFASVLYWFSSFKAVNDIRLNSLMSVFLIILFMLGSLLIWSKIVYPKLVPAIGGGSSIEIQFSVSDPANENQFRAIGIGVDNNLHLTEPVRFLVDTNDALLVLLKNGSAARIDKKLVTNVLYTSPITTTSTGIVTATLPISTTSPNTVPSQITPTP